MRTAIAVNRAPEAYSAHGRTKAQSGPVPLRLMEELRERVVQQRLAGLQVAAGPEEGQPDALSHAHLGLLHFRPQHPRSAQPPHQRHDVWVVPQTRSGVPGDALLLHLFGSLPRCTAMSTLASPGSTVTTLSRGVRSKAKKTARSVPPQEGDCSPFRAKM